MEPKRPNVIYIAADQWRGDCLGLYGNAHPVMTPQFNQLACEGRCSATPTPTAPSACRSASRCSPAEPTASSAV